MQAFWRLVSFFLLLLVLVALVTLSYYSGEVEERYGIPRMLTFLFAIAFTLMIASSLWMRVKEAEDLQYKFLTAITHRFRTPLGGIQWALTALKEERTHEEREALMRQMENATEQIRQVVDTLTGLSRYSASHEYAFEAVSLRQLVDTSLGKFSDAIRAKGVQFSIDAPPDMPEMVLDRQKIQFVIDALIDNAVSYSYEGGAIEIAITLDGKDAVVEVRDHGIGLTWFESRRVFRDFFRGSIAAKMASDGMGLSLVLARTIIRKHGGRITASSWGRGGGATFTVRLPLRAK